MTAERPSDLAPEPPVEAAVLEARRPRAVGPGPEPGGLGSAAGGPEPAATAIAAPGPAPSRGVPEGDASLLALVDRLAALVERSDLTELEVEAGGTAILLRKVGAVASAGPSGSPAEAPPAGRPGVAGGEAGAVASPAPAEAAPGGRAAVLAPLTGIFYASPTPGSAPFVEVGREVVVGQVIGLIEAMKLFNEIKSDKAGRVVRVIPENGALVKAKHPLIEVEPL
jgi:acetyl-CoA carboxylase biotin carboxyl carrier protein